MVNCGNNFYIFEFILENQPIEVISFIGTYDGFDVSLKYPTEISRNMGSGIVCDLSGTSISVSR